MKKNHDNSLQIKILEALAKSDNAVKINYLMGILKYPTLRTVQRALSRLLSDKLIYKIGKGPATSYKIANDTQNLNNFRDLSYQNFINLSKNSNQIIAYVSQPISYKRPVSYHRELLDNYIPNKTWYLDESTRALLHETGKTYNELKPAGTYGREILHKFLIDLSWASSKLEGNTYSKLDTQNLIDFEQYAEGKDIIEAQMILNHKQAINFLVENIEHIDFNKYTILNLHGLLSESLLPDSTDSGNLRNKIVDIGGSVYRPIAIPQVIKECFTTILDKAKIISDPFEQSFFIMVHIPYLQAFVDINKRVSRLSANIPLLKHNLCPLTFIGMPERAYIDGNLGVYELQDYSLLRDVFVWAYKRSAQEYLAAQKSMVAPEPGRLKYREHIHKLVKKIVQDCNENYIAQIKQYAKDNVEDTDQQQFVNMILDDLRNLREGVLARYGISTIQFAAWEKMYR